MSFEKIDICDIKDSFTRLIRDDWALLTAGKAGDYNTMTYLCYSRLFSKYYQEQLYFLQMIVL